MHFLVKILVFIETQAFTTLKSVYFIKLWNYRLSARIFTSLQHLLQKKSSNLQAEGSSNDTEDLPTSPDKFNYAFF